MANACSDNASALFHSPSVVARIPLARIDNAIACGFPVLSESEKRRLGFDAATDLGRAKDVPAEAHRRFRADLRERDERNRQERTTQLALHEEKKRYIAEWVAAFGTDEQKLRQADGMLPMDEAIEGITDQAFVAAAHLPLYMHDGPSRLQAFLRESTGTSDIVIAPVDVTVRSAHAVKATAAQWAVVQQLRSQLPDANVVLREHVLSSHRHNGAGHLTVFGVLVTKKHGPFVLRREYVVEESGVNHWWCSYRLCLAAEFDGRRFRASLAVAVLATPSRRPT